MTNQISQPTAKTPKSLNLWAVYGICLLISTVFFFLFGFNSPFYTFNSDHDFNWFITMGRGLDAGRLPYRDLFEQKGPLVYFVTAFCCLFSNYNLAILFIEIICLSLFFFFAYRLATKRLNTFYSLTVIILLALGVFTSWSRMRTADSIEEFCLPIYAYFLLCWLEFLMEKRSWNWVRALCIGLGFGILFWSKFTLLYFMIAPMIIWLVLSLRRKDYLIIVKNILCMLLGVIIISAPIVIVFVANHALHDLIHVYFIINMTAYGSSDPLIILGTFGLFFAVGPITVLLILWGVISFAIRHWHENSGKLLLTAFLINLALLCLTSKMITYYFNGLYPYAILGAIDIMYLLAKKLTKLKQTAWVFAAVTGICILICFPLSPLTYELGRDRDSYAPLVIADVIKASGQNNPTICCYRIGDFGFYNAAGVIPNTYYFASNFISDDKYPEMGQGFHSYIENEVCDFVITDRDVWNSDQAFLLEHYQPYSYENGEPKFYHYRQLHYFYYRNYDYVLLIRKQ